MLLSALRRILTPSLTARQRITSLQLVYHVNLPLASWIPRAQDLSMASTYSSPSVSSIDDSQQSDDIEAQLAPLRKAVQEQVKHISCYVQGNNNIMCKQALQVCVYDQILGWQASHRFIIMSLFNQHCRVTLFDV